MISGPRVGRPTAWRRLLSGVVARALYVFVVPGPEILDVSGLDAGAAGLHLVANPRHASVLLLVGEIPPGLARAAAVTYAQMPRPRAILAVGSATVGPLPTADVSVERSQAALVAGVHDLCRRFDQGAWATAAPPLGPDPSRDLPGDDPTSRREHGEMSHMDHGRTVGIGHGEIGGMTGHDDMAGMDHARMGGGGFMSMMTMTQDLPRSLDGLPMEWLEVPFGPLHPGLPGGLTLLLTLDGDTVAGAELRAGTMKRELSNAWLGSPTTVAEQLARLDPLSPYAYRVLAWRGLEQASGILADDRELRRRVAVLERERAVSHLVWLGRFGFLLGDAWLAERSADFARQLGRAQQLTTLTELRKRISRFVSQVRRTPLLDRRLDGVGVVDSNAMGSRRGPVARAAGLTEDARAQESVYRKLGFEPVVDGGGDARARCWQRMAEIEQSLELVSAASADFDAQPPAIRSASGVGHATVETPRGAASLTAVLANGQITNVALDTPSSTHAQLVHDVVVGRELSDALIGVASLDLSPWELDR